MDKREAGRLGGKATVAKYGTAHMSALGKRGFNALVKRLRQGRRAAAMLLCSKGKMRPLGVDDDPTGAKFERMFTELTDGVEIPS